jgi:ABC-type uncharacterized transport system permease subunit
MPDEAITPVAPQPATATPIVPEVPQQVAQSYSMQQFTQVNAAIPAAVWTTAALMDLHEKQKEVLDNNVRSLDDQRKRDFKMSLLGYCLIAVVILTGLYFMYKNVTGGKELILGTVAYVAGFLSGRGSK